MGNINFSVFKEVNLNKQVTLDVDKNVNVDVDNNDILATAEADAEAFGRENALAEVDTFTYVNRMGMPTGTMVPSEGFVDAIGNSSNYDVAPPDPDPVTDQFPDTITINFTMAMPTGVPGLTVPTVAAISGAGELSTFTSPPGPPGTPQVLPAVNPMPIDEDIFAPVDLSLTEGVQIAASVVEYTVASPWELDFGKRRIDLDGNGVTVQEPFKLVVPVGTVFDVTFDGDPFTDGLSVVFARFGEEFDPNDARFEPVVAYFETGPGEANPPDKEFTNPTDRIYPLGTYPVLNGADPGFNFASDTEQAPVNVSDYGVNARAIFADFEAIPGDDVGEAFAYAESISAIDLNG